MSGRGFAGLLGNDVQFSPSRDGDVYGAIMWSKILALPTELLEHS